MLQLQNGAGAYTELEHMIQLQNGAGAYAPAPNKAGAYTPPWGALRVALQPGPAHETAEVCAPETDGSKAWGASAIFEN